MKKIKAINGYTIYQATSKDVSKYNVEEDYFYLYFSSDVRDYGLGNCDWDWEAGSIEEAEAFATGTNYAIAKEIVEQTTTAASFEEIQEVEAQLDQMTVKNLISQEIDIDCYDDVCEELGIAFCGPMQLTKAGLAKFAEVLTYPVTLTNDCAIIHIDDKEGVWQKKLRKAKEFFYSLAGYCSSDDYEKWFIEC
jgi:hypothetical protein